MIQNDTGNGHCNCRKRGVYRINRIVPLLLVALITGLAVSIFQATTSIQEQTLAFVPKIVAVLVALVFLDRLSFRE